MEYRPRRRVPPGMTATARMIVSFNTSRDRLAVTRGGRTLFTSGAPLEWSPQTPRTALVECLDFVASQGFWPIGGRGMALLRGPLPLVCVPIDAARAVAKAKMEAREKPPRGWDVEQGLLDETEDAQRTIEIERLRELAGRHPDVLAELVGQIG